MEIDDDDDDGNGSNLDSLRRPSDEQINTTKLSPLAGSGSMEKTDSPQHETEHSTSPTNSISSHLTDLSAETSSEPVQGDPNEGSLAGKDSKCADAQLVVQSDSVPESKRTRTRIFQSKGKPQFTGRLLRAFNHCRDWLTDTWWPEILGLAFSLSCIIGMVGLLLPYTFSHRQVPQFTSGLTLNVFISILSAASKSSLIFSVASTMGQAKWCWFRPERDDGRRRLQDMQTLDDASRGPLGSVQLLFTRIFVSICSIGAVITILALLYEPFLQQLVSYPVQLVQVSTDVATRQALAVGVRYENFDYYGSILRGIYGDETSFIRTPDCPTGNCTWPLFHSAGWCGTSGQLPIQLRSPDCNFTVQDYIENNSFGTQSCTFVLPNGRNFSSTIETRPGDAATPHELLLFDLETPASWLFLLDASDPNFLEYFDSGVQILGETTPMFAFAVPHFPEMDLMAVKQPLTQWLSFSALIFTPCSRLYNMSVQNGQIRSEVIDEDYGILTKPPPDVSLNNVSGDRGYCWRPTEFAAANLTYKSPDTRGIFYVDEDHRSWCSYLFTTDIQAISEAFNGTSSFQATLRLSDLTMYSDIANFSDSHVVGDKLLPVLLGPGMGSLMDGISGSLTLSALASEPQKYVNGSALAERTFVHVRWPWFILPILLNVIGIIFLAITIFRARRLKLPLWKTSAMAMVYHGLDTEALLSTGSESESDAARSYEGASDMAEAARGVYVRLSSRDEEGGGRTQLRR